jgi:hypothetical protein
MIFSYKSQHNTNNEKPRNIPPMPIVLPPTRTISRNVVEQPVPADTTKPKKMKWGEPTWYLFHALAEKVKEDRFQAIRGELLNTIYVICKNLPCPLCANHATQYMNAINFNTIQTKKDLIDLPSHHSKNNVNIYNHENPNAIFYNVRRYIMFIYMCTSSHTKD